MRHPHSRAILAAAWLVLAPAAVAQPPEIPAGGAALEGWLQAGHYKSWRAESAPHDSTDPHFGRVRAFLNPALFDSMQSGAKQHPKGAAAVKELYGQGGQVLGWAVAIKLDAASGGGGNWHWYEKFEARTVADDKGVLLCRGCHLTGRDYVLTPWPLK